MTTQAITRQRKPIFDNDHHNRPNLHPCQKELPQTPKVFQADFLCESAKRFQVPIFSKPPLPSQITVQGKSEAQDKKGSAIDTSQKSRQRVDKKQTELNPPGPSECTSSQYKASGKENASILSTTFSAIPVKENFGQSTKEKQRLTIRMVESKYSEDDNEKNLLGSNSFSNQSAQSIVQQKHVFQQKMIKQTLPNNQTLKSTNSRAKPSTAQPCQQQHLTKTQTGCSNAHSKQTEKQNYQEKHNQTNPQEKSYVFSKTSSMPKITQVQSVVINLPNPLSGAYNSKLEMPQIREESQQNITSSLLKSSRRSVKIPTSNLGGSVVYMELTVVKYPRLAPSKEVKS